MIYFNKESSDIMENKSLKGLVIVLILILLGLAGFIVYDKFIDVNEVGKEQTNNEEIVDELGEVSITEYVDIYNNIKNILYCGLDTTYYNSDKVSVDSFNDDFLVRMAIYNMTSDDFKVNDLKVEDIEQWIKNAYGIDYKFDESKLTSNGNGFDGILLSMGSYGAIYKDNKFVFSGAGCSGPIDMIYRTLYKAEKNSKTLILYEKVGYLKNTLNGDDTYKLYKSLKDFNKVSFVADYNYNGKTYDEDMKKYNDNLPTYKYTFTKNNNEYYLEKIELVK